MNYQITKESYRYGEIQSQSGIYDFRTLAEAEKFLETERSEVDSKYEIDDDFDERDKAKWLKLCYSDTEENNYKWAYYYYFREVPDRILCAAVHYRGEKDGRSLPVNIDSGFVILGRGHKECDDLAEDLIDFAVVDEIDKIYGFLTTSNRFVDRCEAFQIAKNAGQLLSFVDKNRDTLWAGDIFYFEHKF